MNVLIVATLALCLATGLALLVLTVLGYQFQRLPSKQLPTSKLLIAVAAAVCAATYTITGLASLAIAAGSAVALAHSLITKQTIRKEAEARTEAISTFTQSLADSIGGGQSITKAITTAAATPPKPIANQVKTLRANLATRSFDKAIEVFAIELRDPAGDLLGAHLLQANTYATANLGETMRNISETLNEYINATKKVATSRRQQEFEIKGLSVLLIIMIIGLFLMAPDLLSVYQRDIGGEIKLAVVFGCALGGWVMADHLTRSLAKQEFSLKQGAK